MRGMIKTEAMRDRRSTTLGVRFSLEERRAIERAAAQEYRRPSDFVRVLVLRAIYEQRSDQKQNPAA